MVPTSVTLACTRCGAPAATGAAFCSACGQPLAGTAAGAPAPPPAAFSHEPPPGIGAAATYAPVPAIDALARRLAGALGPAYEVGTLLGRGGFAEVYAVRDLRLKRDLAVKVLRPDLVLTEQLIDRFRREAETVAALRHPHIIPIFDIGDKDGLVYLVMPLIRGETLRARMQREERIEPEVVRRVLHEAALALAAAHEAGIVHRDIKPDNIMLEGRAARVLLMDFGIAKALDAGPDVGLTQTGMALGTPHYMSPEQALGERTVDGRSDQYSLGVVGYAMLAGQLPFAGDSVGLVLKQQIADEAPPLRRVVPDVPEELADAIERAMRKDPEARFATAEEFAAELAPPAAGAADALRLPAAPARIALAARPAVRAAAAALGLVALALYAWLYPQSRPVELTPFTVPREAGLAKARAFLERQGGPRYQKEALGLQRSDSALQALRWALGRAGAEAWVARHGGYRAWTLRWTQPPGLEEWAAAVGEGGRLVSFTHVLPDSVRPPEGSDAQGRAAAEAFLAAAGYQPAALAPLEGSVTRDRGRTSRQYAWAERGTPVPSPRVAGEPADSAYMRLDVTVVGDRVTRFRRGVSVPEAFRRAARNLDNRGAFVPGTLALAALATAVGGLVLAARRARLTALPWRTALAGGLALGLVQALGNGLNTTPVWAMEHAPDVNWTMHFLQEKVLSETVFQGVLLGGLLVPVLAAMVPLLRAARPEAAAGVEPLLRGRLPRGALLDACALGYPLAGAVLLASLPAGAWEAPGSNAFPPTYNTWLPVLPLTDGPYGAVATAALLLLGVLVLARPLRRPAPAVALIVVGGAALGAMRDPSAWTGAARLGGLALVAAGGGWWLGLLPTAVALYVATAVSTAASLLGLADVGYAAAGGVAAVLALVPAGLALAARSDASPATTGAPRAPRAAER